jgi:hypothetical protein
MGARIFLKREPDPAALFDKRAGIGCAIFSVRP